VLVILLAANYSEDDAALLQREHGSIRSSKGAGEFLTVEDYKKMEYTQHVCEMHGYLIHYSAMNCDKWFFTPNCVKQSI
jgi:hypothetical protein